MRIAEACSRECYIYSRRFTWDFHLYEEPKNMVNGLAGVWGRGSSGEDHVLILVILHTLSQVCTHVYNIICTI